MNHYSSLLSIYLKSNFRVSFYVGIQFLDSLLFFIFPEGMLQNMEQTLFTSSR